MKFSPYMDHNPLKQKLRDGTAVVGTWLNNIGDPILARVAAVAEMDFIPIDMEHGVIPLRAAAELCSVARLCGLAAFIRPECPQLLAHNGHLLDIGATGLIFPDVQTPEMADALVRSMKYFWGGTRGFVNLSYNSDLRPTRETDLCRSDQETIAVIQIESPEAVAGIDEILSVPGIDVVLVGKGDLTHAMHARGIDDPESVNQAVNQVFESAKRHGVVAGALCATPEEGKRRVQAGVNFLHYANEQSILLGAYSEFVRSIKD